MSNRFFTIMVIPEKTSQVKRFVVPSWLLRSAVILGVLAGILASIMVFDYWYVMSQVSEYNRMKQENRRLQQQVQIFKSKLGNIESTVERIKTFSTRLKVITNIEDRGGLIQSLNQKLPDAAANIGAPVEKPTPAPPENPEAAALRKDQDEMEAVMGSVSQEASILEQTLQDQYELLVDQKAFLSALPTRKPVVGYFTSGFGIRRSPYGGREKMHEGLDIANRPGTLIRAPADGTVLFAEAKAGYGQTLILDHGYGLETWFGHTRRILVKKGQKVRRGDQIALLGNSGRSTGPHLHYEVRVRGTPVDPLSYVLEN